jgi:acyl-coenzyme A synthetase/AMP-(fatty) acid ligase
MKRLLEQIAGWSDNSAVLAIIHGRQLLTQNRFSRKLESNCRYIDSLGLQPGQRCAVDLRDPTQRLLSTLALAAAGLVPVYLPPGAAADSRNELVEQLDLQAVLLSDEQDSLPGITTHTPEADAFSGSHGPFRRAVRVDDEAPALIFFSDDVEGSPRPIAIDFAALQHRMDSAAREFQIDGRARVFCLGIGSARLPISLASLSTGAVQVFGKADPLTLLAAHNVSHAFLGARELQRIANRMQRSPIRLPGLRRLQTFTEHLTPARVRDLTEHLSDNFFAGYFLAEAGYISSAAAPVLRRSAHCRGRPCEGIELKLQSKTAAPVHIGKPGDLWVRTRGSGRFLDHALEDASESESAELWLNTGMLARTGPKGSLFLDGRLGFQRPGARSGPTTARVEQLLMSRGTAEDALVMWLQSPTEEPMLVVLVHSREEQKRVKAVLRDTLPKKTNAKIRTMKNRPTNGFGELLLAEIARKLEAELRAGSRTLDDGSADIA